MQFDLQQLEANYTPYDFRQQAQEPKPQKNFLVDQISTGLGILGGIGGSFISPIAGTAAGAAAGSGLGEAIENKLTGQGLGDNVAKEAALGGLFGAGPIRLAKGGLGLLKGGTTAATKAAGSQAAKEVAEEGAEQVLRTSASGKLANLGNRALTSQYGTISKPIARQTNPSQTIAELAEMGIVKPKDAERVARAITGGSGILNKKVAQAVEGSAAVKTTGIQKIAKDAMTEFGLVDKDAKSVAKVIQAQLSSLKQAKNSPSAALKAMRNLESRAANLQGKGGNYRLSTPERVDQANVLLRVRDEIQDRLFNTAGANANIQKVLTPEVREQLINLQPKSEQWKNFVDNTIMQSKDVGALRSAQSPFVRVQKIINEADDNAFTFGGRMANGGGSLSGRVLDVVEGAVKNPAARASGNALRSASSRLNLTPTPTSPAGIAGRLGTYGLLEGALSQSEDPNMLPNNTMTNPMANSAMPANTNSPTMQSPLQSNLGLLSQTQQAQSSPYSREALLYDIQRDPANMDDYISTYQTLEEIFSPAAAEEKPLTEGQQQRADLMQALTNTEGVVNQGSINFGPVGARLEGLKSVFNMGDPETIDFRTSVGQLRGAIAKARAGASMTPGELALLDQYTPKATDSEQQVMAKLQGLRQLYGYDMPQGGALTLEQAVGAY